MNEQERDRLMKVLLDLWSPNAQQEPARYKYSYHINEHGFIEGAWRLVPEIEQKYIEQYDQSINFPPVNKEPELCPEDLDPFLD